MIYISTLQRLIGKRFRAVALAVTGFHCLLTTITVQAQTTVIQRVHIIDGLGGKATPPHDLWLEDERIVAIKPAGSKIPEKAIVKDYTNKFVMPLIFNTHAHVGMLKGTTVSTENITQENIQRHLLKSQTYGVGAILSLGTDSEDIYEQRKELNSGAQLFTSGRGIGVHGGIPPMIIGSHAYRPVNVEEAVKAVRELAENKADVIKIWVDNFWRQYPKMKPEIYKAVIAEAHQHGIPVAAHVYYAADAEALTDAGIDILAHSIRDTVISDGLIRKMKTANVTYIPTLSLDEFAFLYQDTPEWINDPFFTLSLEDGVWDMVNDPAFKARVRSNPINQQQSQSIGIALTNLKKIYDAGIRITLGTDGGAHVLRGIGFPEHYEMEMMVRAGLPVADVIKIATSNGADLLRIGDRTGSLVKGKKADFMVLDKDPTANILNTRSIAEVWKNGREVNGSPLVCLALIPKADETVNIVATLNILPGFEEEVHTAALEMQEQTKKEKGCSQFLFNINKNNPSVIVFIERFVSKAAFEEHKVAPHTKVFFDKVKGKIEGDAPNLHFIQTIKE